MAPGVLPGELASTVPTLGPHSPVANTKTTAHPTATHDRKTHSPDSIPPKVRSDFPHQFAACVAINLQFGLRDATSRANVQMSVTSLMRLGSPAITSPALSRVAEISSLTNLTVSCAMPFLSSASTISADLIPTKL